MASHASLSINTMPIKLRTDLAISFCTINAKPVSAMSAQVVSPIREPNWTNYAGPNPRAAPRRTVSAVTTPGGAQKAIANKNEEIKRLMMICGKSRWYPRLFPSVNKEDV
jgi:hypothetical protein